MKHPHLDALAIRALYILLLSTAAIQPSWAQDIAVTPAPAIMPAALPTQPAAPAAADNTKPMTLQQAVSIGVATNPNRGVLSNSRRATDAELQQAKGLYLPSVDLRADTGFENTKNPSNGEDDKGLYRNNAGITLTQMLFDGFAAKHENLRQEYRVLSAANRVREASELHGLAVTESYLEVMRQRELLNIAHDNIEQHQKIYDLIRESTEAGKTTEADLEQAQSRLNAAKAETETTRESLRGAEADFIRDVGQAPETLVMPDMPISSLDAGVDTAVKSILAGSPTLAVHVADIKVAHEEYLAAGSSDYPHLDLQVQGQDGDNIGGLRGENRSSSAELVLNWNLYRGGADEARQHEMLYRKAQAYEERAKAARDIEDDVRKTWAGMLSSAERAKEFQAQADANVKIVKAYLDQFTLNRRTLLDVLDSQNELFVSRANAVNSQYLNRFAVYHLVALKGGLLKTLNVPVPREADVRTE